MLRASKRKSKKTIFPSSFKLMPSESKNTLEMEIKNEHEKSRGGGRRNTYRLKENGNQNISSKRNLG